MRREGGSGLGGRGGSEEDILTGKMRRRGRRGRMARRARRRRRWRRMRMIRKRTRRAMQMREEQQR
eukprot:3881743-Pyramimonas_sp.AAC.1